MIEKKEFYRKSSGEGDVFTRSYIPKDEVKAVIEIAHGMSEYSLRYEEFATYLAENKYAVYLNDHLGHGNSSQNHLGSFSTQKGGWEMVLNDVDSLIDLMREEYPGKPVILFGHSMGSILAGCYANRLGNKIDALILMGTPYPNSMVGVGIFLSDIIAKFKGNTYMSPLITKLTSSQTSTKGAKDKYEEKSWLSHDKEVVKKYVDDPLCGYDFSVSGNGEMFRGLKEFGSKQWGKSVPRNLPVLIISGEEDICGKMGEGPKHYYSRLQESNHKGAKLKLVANARHEVLNELNKKETYEYILNWLEKEVK